MDEAHLDYVESLDRFAAPIPPQRPLRTSQLKGTLQHAPGLEARARARADNMKTSIEEGDIFITIIIAKPKFNKLLF